MKNANYKILNLTKILGLCSLALSNATAFASPESDLITAVKTAQKDQIQMSNFLQRFGVEIAREQNMQISGSIRGSLNGSIGGLSLGNVPALADGILGLGAEAASIVNPFSSLAAGLSPVSSLLRGLSGMGFLDGSISGQLSGSIEGSGYQINNEAHSFLVVGKNRTAFENVVNTSANAAQLPNQDTSTLNTLMAVLNNSYIVDDGEVAQFNHMKMEFRDTIHTIDSLVANNIASNNKIYERAKNVSDSLKAWARTKRVTFAMAGNGPIPIEQMATACSVHVSKPGDKYGCGPFQENGAAFNGGEELNHEFCLEVPSSGWETFLDSGTFTTPENNHPLFAGCGGPSPYRPDQAQVNKLSSVFRLKSGNHYRVPGVATEDVIHTLFNPSKMDIQTDQYIFF